MIPENVWQLVPGEFPKETPLWVTNFAKAAKFEKREEQAYLWAMNMLSNYRRYISTAVLGLMHKYPPYEYSIEDISAGFIPFSAEQEGTFMSPRQARMSYSSARTITEGGVSYAFGLVIGISVSDSIMEQVAKDEHIELSQVVGGEMPFVAEFRKAIEHNPPNPVGVTATCYARPRVNKRFFGPQWSDGIVIARHVLANVGFALGTTVQMQLGGTAIVSDIDSATTIDAAVLDFGSAPAMLQPLLLAPAVAPGTDVYVRTASGGFDATVLRIYEDPHYFGNMMSHRVVIDRIGVSGNSGALVRRKMHGDAVGIYIGSTGQVPAEGLVQSMRQVTEYFGIELFD